MTQQTTQSTMSNKHLDATAVAVAIVLSAMAEAYFDKPGKEQHLKIREAYIEKSTTLTIDKAEARELSQLKIIEDLNDVLPHRLTSVSLVEITHHHKGRIITNQVRVDHHKRNAYLSRDFLKHIQLNGYTLDARGNFVFSLDKWDAKKPIFQYVKREQNFSQHAQEVAKIIESSMEDLTERENPESPYSTLQELFDLVNSKLKVPLSCLEVMVYACMIPEPNNYDMARNAPKPVLGIARQILANRSLSAFFIYQGLPNLITTADPLIRGNRPDHPMDVLFGPKQTLDGIRLGKRKYNRALV